MTDILEMRHFDNVEELQRGDIIRRKRGELYVVTAVVEGRAQVVRTMEVTSAKGWLVGREAAVGVTAIEAKKSQLEQAASEQQQVQSALEKRAALVLEAYPELKHIVLILSLAAHEEKSILRAFLAQGGQTAMMQGALDDLRMPKKIERHRWGQLPESLGFAGYSRRLWQLNSAGLRAAQLLREEQEWEQVAQAYEQDFDLMTFFRKRHRKVIKALMKFSKKPHPVDATVISIECGTSTAPVYYALDALDRWGLTIRQPVDRGKGIWKLSDKGIEMGKKLHNQERAA